MRRSRMAAAPSNAATLNTPRTAVRSASRSACVTRQSEVERRCVGVGPGGKVQERPGGVLDQQGQNEVREQPAAGEGRALGREPIQAQQAFEPLEGEFDSLDANDKRGCRSGLTWSGRRSGS